MAVEYNVVIVGDGALACDAAIQARQMNARVALVVPSSPLRTEQLAGRVGLQALRHLGYGLDTYRTGPYGLGGMLFPNPSVPNVSGVEAKANASVAWAEVLRTVQTLMQRQVETRSPSQLVVMGVDVIYGDGEFVTEPGLGYRVGDRVLSSQSYLLALDGEPVVPAIAGIESVRYSTLDRVFQPDRFPQQPRSVLVITNGIEGIEAASAFAALGTAVTLITDQPVLLPSADVAVNQWLKTSLAAAGVTVYVNATVQQLAPVDHQCQADIAWMTVESQSGSEASPPVQPTEQATGQATEQTSGQTAFKTVVADELVLAMGRQVDFTRLNLRAVGVNYDAQGIGVNHRYQSSHSRIFAVGDAVAPAAIGEMDSTGDRTGSVQSRQAVAIALNVALFQSPLLRLLKSWVKPPLPTRPTLQPHVVGTHPPVAWAGWSETEARHRYGDRVRILHQPWQTLAQAQRLNAVIPAATAGFCKLVVLDNGQIVGVHLVGVQGEELINSFVLAMHHSIPLDDLATLHPPTSSLMADLMQALIEQWRRDRLQQNPRLFDGLELAFNWQRDWTK